VAVMRVMAAVLGVATIPWPAFAGPPAGGAATAVAVEVPSASAIRLDGDLTDEVWSHAPPITEFVQRDPKEGAEPSMKTEARLAYDATNLYVAVRAFDPEPARLVGHLTRRDSDSPSDWIRVTIDSFHDRRTAYEFAVNPAGVKKDKYWFNDGNSDDTSWDAVWDVAVIRDGEGWRAEFRIPFSQLRFNANDGGLFGLAITRQIARLNESNTWPLLSKKVNGYVSQFGDLSGIQLNKSPKRLELLPYTVGSVTTQPDGGSPLLNSTDPSAALGLDLKYALTPGLTLTATVNPDFGQVEADPAVVNLSAFETFFSERRPFFVEGSGNFRFDVDCNDGSCTGLFYTRRIGRAPQATGNLPDGDDTYALVPPRTTILGAAKVTGRKGAYSIGLLHAVTQEERAAIAIGSQRASQVVEPMTNYSVARVRREFKNQSSLGFISTATARRLTESTSFLPGQAFTGGVDADWRFRRRYSLTAYWAGSSVRGNADAIAELQQTSRHYFQRPDSTSLELDPTRTSLSGQSAGLSIGKIGGEYMVFNSNVGYKSPGYDTNDLGFFRRADQRTESNWIQFRSNRPNRFFRFRSINFNQYAGWNRDGDRLYSGGNINSHYTLVNNWSFGGGFNVNADEFDDRLTRGGPGGLVEGFKSFWTYVNSDSRKVVTFNGFFGRGWTKNGSWFSDINPDITVRPMSSLSFSGGVGFNRNVATQQWIENIENAGEPTHYVFGHLDQTTVSLTTRVNYTVSPTLSIQIYAQPFVSAGDYSSFQELANGRATRFGDRWAAYAYGSDPDFNYRSFRTTNVIRWEYKPGSTLFVVWQQGREESITRGDFRFGRDFGQAFSVPATNVLLVKLAYWLNY
jgi:uncharacterized protein DUF5916/cellulose/xylan binding protein with CBM9 domain